MYKRQEFEKIVFHGLRHSSATYQLLQSGGDFKSVQGNTGHATATVLMDTYAHTQDKPRLELTEKIEADFYTPVSYTHLDVYKRQPHDRLCLGSGERVKDRANGVAGNEGFAAACRYLEAEIWNTRCV